MQRGAASRAARAATCLAHVRPSSRRASLRSLGLALSGSVMMRLQPGRMGTAARNRPMPPPALPSGSPALGGGVGAMGEGVGVGAGVAGGLARVLAGGSARLRQGLLRQARRLLRGGAYQSMAGGRSLTVGNAGPFTCSAASTCCSDQHPRPSLAPTTPTITKALC